MRTTKHEALHDHIGRPVFLRPSPIDKLGAFAERHWWKAVALFLVWVFWMASR